MGGMLYIKVNYNLLCLSLHPALPFSIINSPKYLEKVGYLLAYYAHARFSGGNLTFNIPLPLALFNLSLTYTRLHERTV